MRALVFLLAFLALSGAASAEDACTLPLPAPDAALRLPHAGGTEALDVLAIGSASMLGPEGGRAGSIGTITANLLQAELHRPVTVSVIGQRGESARTMLDTLRARLAGGHVRLVLWQTGTVEAIHRTELAEFRAVLAEGLGLIREAGADAILIDQQFSRRMAQRVDMRPYRAALDDAARAHGAWVFDRFALMRGWAEQGALDLDRTRAQDRAAVMARLHLCLATALARNIVAALNH